MSKQESILAILFFLPVRHGTFIRSAGIYRALRKKGITIRKSVDCMTASVAMEYDARLLHHDRDFDTIAKHFELKVFR